VGGCCEGGCGVLGFVGVLLGWVVWDRMYGWMMDGCMAMVGVCEKLERNEMKL